MSTSNFFPEGAALLRMLFQNTNGELGTLFDLGNLKPKEMEIERKYEIVAGGSVDERFAGLFDKIVPASKKLNYRITKCTVFAGFDQYYVLCGKGDFKATFRHRFSANVPTELAVKIQLHKNKNVERGEFTLDLRDTNMQSVRAFMAVVCKLARSYKHFCVHQSGVFWTLQDVEGRRTEVVGYKVGRHKEAASRVFVEIEPKKFEDAEQALSIINKLEAALGFKKMRCDKSIAEIFGS